MSIAEPAIEPHRELDAFNLEKLVGNDGPLRMIIQATLIPVAGLDRFQPAGFPEIGHVIYKAPRPGATSEHICIVDSPASMANHLETVCRAAPHDPDASRDLVGMPYLRCVTDAGWPEHRSEENNGKPKQVVVTSLTEGHRIASGYFLEGRTSTDSVSDTFEKKLSKEFGILNLGKKAHAPPDAWWTVFATIFKYDPNALIHGVMFPKWQIKIARVLSAHLEAFGAARIDRSGVKFDRLGKTTSGQPIFAVDDSTAREIRATFILDLALLRSFGRDDKGKNDETIVRGLSRDQKQFLLALALWKIGRLIGGPFRYRSGCDLECKRALFDGQEVRKALTAIGIQDAIRQAHFALPVPTDIYWPADTLYRESSDEKSASANDGIEGSEDESEAGE